MEEDEDSVVSDVIGWRPSQDGLHIELVLGTPDGRASVLAIDPAALLHLVPVAANTQVWQEEAERHDARTLRTYMDVDKFVVGLDTADTRKLTLSLRLISGGSLTFHFDRAFGRELRDTLVRVLP